MNLLSRRCILAIAAVVDIALRAQSAPVAAKALAARHRLGPRRLETLLQGLVQANILRGVRGPHGGYQLAREKRKITVGEIVRTALRVVDAGETSAASKLVRKVIEPSVRNAGGALLDNLDTVTVEKLCNDAVAARVMDEEKLDSDFAV